MHVWLGGPWSPPGWSSRGGGGAQGPWLISKRASVSFIFWPYIARKGLAGGRAAHPQATSRGLKEEEPAAASPKKAAGQSPLRVHGACAELHPLKFFPTPPPRGRDFIRPICAQFFGGSSAWIFLGGTAFLWELRRGAGPLPAEQGGTFSACSSPLSARGCWSPGTADGGCLGWRTLWLDGGAGQENASRGCAGGGK